MSAFSNATFSAQNYLASRPTYPAWLYRRILDFHRGKFDKALDIGCGPGISTLPLLPHFRKVTGTDTSNNMVSTATQLDTTADQLEALTHPELKSPGQSSRPFEVEFVQGSAESMPFVEDSSVDLVVSGQAAHWFDYSKFWPELTRICRPRATVALWGYAEVYLPRYPGVRQLVSAYSGGREEFQLGPYWEQPGRGIVERGLSEVPFPWEPQAGLDGRTASQWDSKEFLRGIASTSGLLPSQLIPEWPAPLPSTGNVDPSTETMDKTMSWEQLLGYLHTFSALHRYGKSGKHVDEPPQRLIEAIKQEVFRQGGEQVETVLVRWPLSLMLCRKL